MRRVNGEAQGESRVARAAQRTVLVVSATHRDHRELKRLSPSGVDLRFHDCASTSVEELITGAREPEARAADPDAEIDRILAGADGRKIGAVLSTDDYPGSACQGPTRASCSSASTNISRGWRSPGWYLTPCRPSR
jgi:hypothetical protein